MLGGKKILVVLDDVWCESIPKWDELFGFCRQAHAEVKFIVTTRSQKVANRACSAHSYALMPLSDEECLKIFEGEAFVNGALSSYPNLQVMAKNIIEKVHGLPLAARIAGSILGRKPVEKWRDLLCDDEGFMSLITDSALPILRTSYNNLPPHLKPCLIYCSIFPKGHKFQRKGLIQMWMAQGFVQSVGVEHRNIEDIGKDYFDDLVERSFFQCTDGYYVMHNLLHDLSVDISENECCRIEQRTDWGRGPLHLSFSYNGFEHFGLETFDRLKKVRTLIYLHEFSSVISTGIPRYLFQQLKCIRVLDLSNNEIKYLPDSIGDLKQLRYLDLSFTEIENLPDSLCSLHNLQTLKLMQGRWHRLPEGISNLVSLMYLNVDTELFAGIAGIGKLTGLQELKVFNVCKENGHKIGELTDMRGLGGSLCIQNLDNIESGEEAGQAKLMEKRRLVELKLYWAENFNDNLNNEELTEEVLEGLQPPPSLEVLEIRYNRGVKYPSWMEVSLPSTLTSICLYNCRKWKTLPILGELPCLRSLKIGGMHGVKHVGHEFYGKRLFPKLNELDFEDMLNWERWVVMDKEQLFPSLRTFHIVKCPSLTELPQLPSSLTDLVIWELGLHALPEMHTRYEFLSSLVIYGCPNLKSLQNDVLHLRNLTKLDIRKCKELTSLDLHAFHSIESLRIEDCPKITLQLPEGAPSSLQRLHTDNSKFLAWLLPQTSSCVRQLTICNCSELKSFTNEDVAWELPTKLEEIYIWDCHNLDSLPDGLTTLPFLVKFDIRGCPRVQCLPETGFPPSLRRLHIGGCELLAEHCQVGVGPDWPKIAHVPFLCILGLEEDHAIGSKEEKNQLLEDLTDQSQLDDKLNSRLEHIL